MYILRDISREFIKEFYREVNQGYNGAIGLIKRL